MFNPGQFLATDLLLRRALHHHTLVADRIFYIFGHLLGPCTLYSVSIPPF